MKSSYKIFTIAGIRIELHISFLLFFGLIFFLGLNEVLFFTLIFSLVFFHELMHSLVALLNGVKVPKITLLPIGGLASIQLPEDPELELKVSLAGPLSNFIIAFITFFAIIVSGSNYISYGNLTNGLVSGSFSILNLDVFLSIMLTMNILLGGFNMLPAFPMDGGRIFRSILAFWMNYYKATKIAVNVGRSVFLAMVFAGFLTFNFWWVIIGLFLSVAGTGELRMVGIRNRFVDLKMHDIERKNFGYVNHGLTISEFLERVFTPKNRFYLAADSYGGFTGLIDTKSFDVKSTDGNALIKDFVSRDFELVDDNVDVIESMKKILSKEFILVSRNGRVTGYFRRQYLEER